MIRNIIACVGSVFVGVIYGKFIYNEMLPFFTAVFSFFGMVAVYIFLFFLIDSIITIYLLEREED